MVPEVRILSDEEVRLMHTRALDILGKVGIKYESKRALDLLAEHGQRVDLDKGLAWLSPDIVERCLESTPRVITLAGRDPKHDLRTDGQHLYVTTNGQATCTQDYKTGERRQGLVKDLRDSTNAPHYIDGLDDMRPT